MSERPHHALRDETVSASLPSEPHRHVAVAVPPQSNCYFCDASAFHLDIMETDYWRVTLAQEQSYLGRFFVILKRHAEALKDLTPQEAADWQGVVVAMETALQLAFGSVNFNWACMMNFAYKKQPHNPHVHWHVRPRYSRVVEVNGVKFEDPDFGDHYSRDRKVNFDASDETLREIHRRLLSAVAEKP